MSDRIQCSHCDNPNQGKSACRYLWYRNITKKEWSLQGFDLPCVEYPDQPDRPQRTRWEVRDLRRSRATIAWRALAIAAVVALALYLRSH
ncbi:hypothetical protein FIU28_17385 [Tardiphaga sp. vice154]|uniref:hypothetical protein n=1 Tax=Tardiphaga sp. vice154 TaxID=2592814 RepID=UPI00116266ED|nr:hypothetical protein [Tardiphaga sp. vice154]QDM22725.1 hypothetical protein FIU28_17385 [Tardiphaga sp. vice154]